MDQFTAHLDRGWDLAQRGDAGGAESSARKALELEAQSPEAHNLLGYACALRGDFDDALENYRTAIALDDTFLEAILNAAELSIAPLGDFKQALSLCEDALELAENEGELTDALLLKFDALLGLGDHDSCLATLRLVPGGPFENPGHAFLVGRAFFEMGDFAKAEELLVDAGKREPENPEIPYYLALIFDQRGDVAAATHALLRSRELDGDSPPPPWGLSRDAFLAATQKAAQSVTARLRAYLDPQEIFVTDLPGTEIIVEGADPRAPVLVDTLDEGDLRVRVFVYQKNIERIAGAVERISEEIRDAIEREVAAVLMSDDLSPPPEGAQLN
jgi:Flp pilus assembly protein TadD